MKFIWDESYSVVITEIDEQHKNYFSIANRLGELADHYSKEQEKQLEFLFDELLNYAFYHLSTEEEYFDKCAYEETKEHTRQHDFYRSKMKQYREKIRKPAINKSKLAKEVQKFAVVWLSEHILRSDKKYTSCLTKCLLPEKKS